MLEDIKGFRLLELKKSHKEYIKNVYNWYKKENQMNHYTCRPLLEKKKGLEEYIEGIYRFLESNNKIFILILNNEPLGKVTLFDYNIRNKSAEFGYYFPEENRGKGYGQIAIKSFLEKEFNNKELELNKLYATTASGNKVSIKILEKLGFSLDGRLREHYWIDNKKEDQLNYSILKRDFIV